MFLEKACGGLCGLQIFIKFWLKHQSSFNLKLGPLSDTLHAGACLRSICSIPPVLTSGSIWVVLWLFVFRSAPSKFPQKTSHLLVAISGSPGLFRSHSKLARTIFSLSHEALFLKFHKTRLEVKILWQEHLSRCTLTQVSFSESNSLNKVVIFNVFGALIFPLVICVTLHVCPYI